jgi:hypothetical protein
MMGKREQLDRIRLLDAQIKKMIKQNKKGAELSKIIDEVIALEEDYEKRHGRDPNAQL